MLILWKMLKFSDKPDEIIQQGADYCQGCGESLTGSGGTVLSRRQEIEIPEKPIQIIYGRRFKAFCLMLPLGSRSV